MVGLKLSALGTARVRAGAEQDSETDCCSEKQTEEIYLTALHWEEQAKRSDDP